MSDVSDWNNRHKQAAKLKDDEIERLQDALRVQLGQDKARPQDYDMAVERCIEREAARNEPLQDELIEAEAKIERLTAEVAEAAKETS